MKRKLLATALFLAVCAVFVYAQNMFTLFNADSKAAVASDIIPTQVSAVNPETLGLYQAAGEVDIYRRPNGQIIKTIDWKNISPDMFVIYIPENNMAFLAVNDETENWLEIIYNNSTGAKGWIKKEDPEKFLGWARFVSVYGKKYGLTLLKGTPDSVKTLYSAPDAFSKIVGRINQPQKINLTAIRGNWALVSVYDIDKVTKTGYIRWRANNGVKYLLPAMR